MAKRKTKARKVKRVVRSSTKSKSYSKRPVWQLIALYLLVGAVVYALVYYFFMAKQAGYDYNNDYKINSDSSYSAE